MVDSCEAEFTTMRLSSGLESRRALADVSLVFRSESFGSSVTRDDSSPERGDSALLEIAISDKLDALRAKLQVARENGQIRQVHWR